MIALSVLSWSLKLDFGLRSRICKSLFDMHELLWHIAALKTSKQTDSV